MKHLQLNTSTLRDPNKIISFITSNAIDIACLQEISYTKDSPNPIQTLANQNHLNTDDYYPKEIGLDPLSRSSMINDVTDISKDTNFPGSRGLKHSIKSRCILSTLLQTPTGLLRVISTQFTVSDACTETVQMLEMSKIINSLVMHSANIPTIFSGDLNIRARSYSVSKLSEAMTCHTLDIPDTLSLNHPAKKRDFPNGLAVDHVFSKNLKHVSTEAIDVNFSDHKAIISEFNL